MLKVVNNCLHKHTHTHIHGGLNIVWRSTCKWTFPYKNSQQSCSNLLKEKYFLIKYQIKSVQCTSESFPVVFCFSFEKCYEIERYCSEALKCRWLFLRVFEKNILLWWWPWWEGNIKIQPKLKRLQYNFLQYVSHT